MRDMTGAELDTFYRDHKCIFCGLENSFLCGPRSGFMVNVKCEKCGCVLNVTDQGFLPIGQVISEPAIPMEPVIKRGGTGWWRRLLGL